MRRSARTFVVLAVVCLHLALPGSIASGDTIVDWTAWLSRVFSTHTAADSVASGAPLTPSWGMTLSAFESEPFPVSIELVTSHAASELRTFPAVAPELVPGGLRYTWSGMTPFFTSSVAGIGFTVDSPLGFNAERSLSGGRRVAAHTSDLRTLTLRATTLDPMIALTVATDFSVPAGAPLSTSGIDCPGSTPIIGSPSGRAWRLDAPAPGTASTFVCTFTLANTGDADFLYMPWVNLWSDRSFVTTTPELGVHSLEIADAALGIVHYNDGDLRTITPRGSKAEIDIRTATLDGEARTAPHGTALQILTTGIHTYGFMPPLSATLTDTVTATPLAGQTVVLELLRQGVTVFSSTVTTDAGGVARSIFTPQPLPDTYTVRATFAGTSAYLGSTATAPLVIVNSGGRVLGAVRLPGGGRATMSARSTGDRVFGFFDLASEATAYHATSLLALGISGDRAILAAVDDAGTRATITVDDEGAPGTLDRLSIVIGDVEQNPGGSVSSGNLEIAR